MGERGNHRRPPPEVNPTAKPRPAPTAKPRPDRQARPDAPPNLPIQCTHVHIPQMQKQRRVFALPLRSVNIAKVGNHPAGSRVSFLFYSGACYATSIARRRVLVGNDSRAFLADECSG